MKKNEEIEPVELLVRIHCKKPAPKKIIEYVVHDAIEICFKDTDWYERTDIGIRVPK